MLHTIAINYLKNKPILMEISMVQVLKRFYQYHRTDSVTRKIMITLRKFLENDEEVLEDDDKILWIFPRVSY